MKHSRFNFSHCVAADSDPIVRNGLSLSPAELAERVRMGVPVNTYSLQEIQIPAQSDNDMSVDPDFCRGADLNSVWTAKMDAIQKAREHSRTLKFNNPNPSQHE